jgi:hypothetical protein
MKRLDVIIIISLLLISSLFLLIFNMQSSNEVKKVIEIQVGDEIYRRIAIKSDDYKETIPIKSNLGVNILRIHDGGIEMIDSDCRNNICINTGFVSKPGEMIVCLPHKVLVQIKDKTELEK